MAHTLSKETIFADKRRIRFGGAWRASAPLTAHGKTEHVHSKSEHVDGIRRAAQVMAKRSGA
jgi:hypothetical protein